MHYECKRARRTAIIVGHSVLDYSSKRSRPSATRLEVKFLAKSAKPPHVQDWPDHKNSYTGRGKQLVSRNICPIIWQVATLLLTALREHRQITKVLRQRVPGSISKWTWDLGQFVPKGQGSDSLCKMPLRKPILSTR